MAMIVEVSNIQGQVIISCAEVWRSTDDLLSLFVMDPLRDIDKASSNQMIIEDVETKRNLSQRAIEATNKLNVEVIEKRLIQPSKIITLTEDVMQHVEQILIMKIIIPMCKSQADLERTQLLREDSILKDFKNWKSVMDAKEKLSGPP
jgi:hypothetical protein